MKLRIFPVIGILCILSACSESGKSQTGSAAVSQDSVSLTKLDSMDPPAVKDSVTESEIDLQESMTMDFFVVVADTSYNYHSLRTDMINTSRKFKIQIDSMGRFYNGSKNKIQLPDDDEDEIYAGEYFPRRSESTELSVEYASQYLENCNDSLMAGIMGIYERQEEALNRLKKIKSLNPKAFVIKASLYQGCMH